MAGGMTPKDNGHGTLAERLARTKAAEDEREEARVQELRDKATAEFLARPRHPGHSTAGFNTRPRAEWSDVLRDAAPDPEPQPDPGPARHCWYDGPHGRQAALLLEWSAGGQVERRGLVAVAHLEPDGHWAIVEMWVEQGMLSPA